MLAIGSHVSSPKMVLSDSLQNKQKISDENREIVYPRRIIVTTKKLKGVG